MLLASVSASFTSQVAHHGVYAVFGLMAIDAVFPALSELVMLYAGALAAGAFTGAHGVTLFGSRIGFGAGAFVVLALAGTLGYLAGALVGWGIGRYGGRPLFERRGGWVHLSPERLDRAEAWFERWGNVGVLVGRLTPVVRSFVSIPAGIFEMPLAPYTVLTLVGSAVWSFAFAGAGYGLGSSYRGFDHGFHYAEYAVAVGIVALLAYLVYRRRSPARQKSTEPGTASTTVAPRADDSTR
jgi:membrane protein DedA with SNARE-associated domain